MAGPPATVLGAAFDEAAEMRDQGAYDAALSRLEAALETSPDDVDLLLLEGQILTLQGRADEALVPLERGVGLAPDYLDLHLARARALAETGQSDTALRMLDPLVERHGSSIPLHMMRARLAMAAGEPEVAQRAFEQVLQVEPANGEALLGGGDASVEAGDTQAARAYYERALEVPGMSSLAARRLVVLSQKSAPFELVVDAGHSWINAGRDDWNEANASLAYAVDEKLMIYLGSKLADRYGEQDMMFSATAVRRLDDTKSVNLGLDVTPGADFLPEWRVRLGADMALAAIREELAGTMVFTELAVGEYPDGLVRSLTLGLTQYLGDGDSWVTLRTTHSLDSDGEYDFGISGRLDVAVDDRTRLFIGGAHELDRDDRGSDTIRSIFGGVEHDLTPRLGIFGSLTFEDRDNGVERLAAVMGLKLRFGER